MQETPSELWRCYRKRPDERNREQLIVHYLHLVKWVVGRVASTLPQHVKIEDLYSSGVLGLIRAIERFDPSKNAKFESYAILLIKGAIIDELRRLDWIPRSVHQKANQIAKASEDLAKQLGREPTEMELANFLSMTEKDLGELLERIRPAILISLNGEVEGEEESIPIAESIADDHALNSSLAAEQSECNRVLEKAISELPTQEREVLFLYYFEELMLKEIGQLIGVSESRVCQIHSKALLRLKGKMKAIRR